MDFFLQIVLRQRTYFIDCLLYTSDAADEEDSVDLGGRRIIQKQRRDCLGDFNDHSPYKVEN